MTRSRIISLVWIAVLGAAGLQAAAQTHAAQSTPAAASSLDVAITYNAQSASLDTSSRFWAQGGSVQLHAQFWRGLGVVGDVAETHTAHMHGSSAGLDLTAALFGPRYTWQLPYKKTSVYAQALGGEGWGRNSIFPDSGGTNNGVVNGANNAAWMLGTGANWRVNRRLSWRVAEANWLVVYLPNTSGKQENNLRLGTGIVIHIL